MGFQVIRQPGAGLFGVFSTETDTFVMWEATREDVVEFFVEVATTRARRDAARILDHIEAGRPRDAYSQFAMTWEQAVAMDREHGGEMSTAADPSESTMYGIEPGGKS